MKNNSTAIIGMILWNSYFDETTIRWIVWTVREKFEAVEIMIPDHPAKYTYQALWEKNPASKVLSKGNALRNKVRRVISWTEHILDWKEEINTHASYKKAVKEILQLSKTNEAFKKALEETTREVLAWKVEISEERIRIWIKFLICELAFLISAKEILWNKVTYVYHRPWQIFTDLITWKFDGTKRAIDFEIIAKEG